jgi:hypothetical protein
MIFDWKNCGLMKEKWYFPQIGVLSLSSFGKTKKEFEAHCIKVIEI